MTHCRHTLLVSTFTLLTISCLAERPQLAPQWRAVILGMNQEPIQGSWRYDAALGRLGIDINRDASYISPDFQDSMGINCTFNRDDPAKNVCVSSFRSACFSGLIKSRTEVLMILFGALPRAQPAGNLTLSGEVCKLWTVKLAGIGQQWVCLGSDGIPRALYSTAEGSYVGPSNVGVATFNITFHNVTSGPQDLGEAKCADDLHQCQPVCPDEGVVALELLRVTSGEPWGELYARDTADFPGEITGFVRPSDLEHFRKYIEIFNVTANSSWGKWRDCNYIPEKGGNVCDAPLMPNMSKLVTRMSAENFQGPCSGLCAKNDLVGSWYTFPKEGRCESGESIGTNGCTWKLESAKVVLAECVYAVGQVAAAWKKDFGKAPWLNVQAALRVGVKGCPDVRVPELPAALFV